MASIPQMVYQGTPTVTTNTAPLFGAINKYNASTGPLSVTLPLLSSLNPSVSCILQKDPADLTTNAIIFTPASGGDSFDNGVPSVSLTQSGEIKVLQKISISGANLWMITNTMFHKGGITSLASEFALTDSASAAVIIGTNLDPGLLAVGATYRISVDGTIQVAATSGTLTFTAYLQNTALAQTAQMPSQGVAAGPVPLHLDCDITVRSTGASGTVIAKPFGLIGFTPPLIIGSTSASATTVDTTAAASSTALALQAQWASALPANSLLVETATIERVF